jgi:hypothetical protein
MSLDHRRMENPRRPRRSLAATLAASLALALLGPGAPAHAGLVITPTFDSSITGNANSAILQQDINNAIGIYQSTYSDPINVSILFRYATTQPNGNALGANTLAQSNYTLYTLGYNTYINALTADATSANDASAVANLPAPGAFPNNPTNILPSSADGRAVGLGTPGAMDSSGNVGVGGTFDGIVTINSSQPFQLDRTGGIANNKYDVMQSIEHEIDEVLGLGSVLPSTKDFNNNPAVRPEDLFRYSSQGNISLTSSGTASSYFSIDGGASKIANFNQNSNGDYGDWGASAVPLVQLAFSNPGTQSDVSANSPEGIALDVIGYTFAAAVPEPSSVGMLGMGLALTGLVAWKRRRRGE